MSSNIYDSVQKKLIPFAGNSKAEAGPLESLEDVNISSPTDGQALVYDGTAEEWKNAPTDSTPTSGSANFVKSGGVYTARDGKVDKVTGKGLSANDYTNADKAIVSTEKGTASGVAELDANGKVPSSQLPGFVDDVKEGYLNSADGKFYEESTYETEITPEADKIYVDKATNITYRWSGSAFVGVGSDLALGETSTTAYRGDRGKIAYDHATDANKISAATASGFYKVGATAEGHVSSLTAVAKADITALGIPDADDLGTAATKDSTSTITSGSTDLIEGGAVYTALDTKLNNDGDSKNNTTTFTSSDVADGSASAWTSVAVLASGEKHSSIFAKISQMFKNIRYLYKMLGTTSISSIGGGTVTGAISSLNSKKYIQTYDFQMGGVSVKKGDITILSISPSYIPSGFIPIAAIGKPDSGGTTSQNHVMGIWYNNGTYYLAIHTNGDSGYTYMCAINATIIFARI